MTEAYWHAKNDWIYAQMQSCMSSIAIKYNGGIDYNSINKEIETLMQYSIELMEDNHREQMYQVRKQRKEALECAEPST